MAYTKRKKTTKARSYSVNRNGRNYNGGTSTRRKPTAKRARSSVQTVRIVLEAPQSNSNVVDQKISEPRKAIF